MNRQCASSWKRMDYGLSGSRFFRSFTKDTLLAITGWIFLVEDSAVVELKSVERFDPIFEAQILTYLRVSGKRVGLLINFNSRLLRDGIKRFVLTTQS